MPYQCPQCHSENIQRVSLAVSQGTKASTFFGIGGSSGGIGAGAGAGVSQTMQAQSLTPPSARKVIWWLLGTLLFLPAAFSGVSLAIAIALICSIGLARAVIYNKRDFPKEFADWKQLWVCQRCANVFKLGEFN